MLSLQMATGRVAPHVRGAAPRAQRVFTDAEWDVAIKSSASKLAALEASFAKASTESSASAAAAAIPAAGKVFTDAEWDMVVKRAPQILMAMNGAEGEVVGGTAGDEPDVPSGDRLFSEKQWESAIRRAVEAASKDEVLTFQAEKHGMPAAATSFEGVLAFTGTAPEVTNGRVAMIGFVAATAAELSSGSTAAQQFAAAPVAICAAAAIIAAASLIPLFAGTSAKDAAVGPFTADAETVNGRAAMIGIAVLLAIEASRGSGLF